MDRISDFIVGIADATENCYNILICGDFNSRVGVEHDFVILDNTNNDYLPDDYVPDDFLPRVSEDKKVNANGRKLLDFCRQNDLRICNGRLGDDKNIGKFTFTGNTGRSVVDYVITNPSMFNVFKRFSVCDPNILSDHCIIRFSMLKHTNIYTTQSEETDSSERLYKKYKWDEVKKDEYIFNLNGSEHELLNLVSNLTHASKPDDIDENIGDFLNLMENVCDPIFAKLLKIPNETDTNYSYNHQSNRPWFDEECQALRDSFYKKLNIYRNNKNNTNEKNMIKARSDFKNMIRKKRYIYDKSQTEKLISTKYDNAKAYWRLLKHASNQNVKHPISAKQFAEYFKAINDPDGRFFQVDEDILFFNERYVKGEFQIMFDE